MAPFIQSTVGHFSVAKENEREVNSFIVHVLVKVVRTQLGHKMEKSKVSQTK